jgi:hypothetical protein
MVLAGLAMVALHVADMVEARVFALEASLQAFGSFVETTTGSAVHQSATNSGGVRASYRFFLNLHSGVDANYGYALNTQSLFSASGPLGVKTNSHEVSGGQNVRRTQS